MMIKKYKRTAVALSAFLLVACVSKTGVSSYSGSKNDVVSKIETPEVFVSSAFNEDRPVDIAPLVSNYIAARMSEAEGRTADAAFFYDRAEAADPQNDELKERAFTLQLALGNMEESLRLAYTMAEKEDAMPISFILLAANSIKNGNLDEAKRFISKAQKISPRLLQFHVLDAYIDLEQGVNIDDIILSLKDLPPMSGLSAIRHYHMGNLLEKAGKFKEAQQEYEFSFETDPGSTFTVLALESIYERTNQPDKVKLLFNTFKQKSPNNVMLLNSIRRIGEGLPYSQVDKTLSEDSAGVIFEIATLMSSQKLAIAAAQLVHISLMLDDKNSFIVFYKAVLQEQSGSYDAAIASYNSVREDDYTWLGGQIRIADILTKQGKLKEAIKFVETLSKKYSHSIIERVLAELYYNNSNYEKSIVIYDKLLSKKKVKSKDDFWMYFARGTAYERLAKYEEAEKDLKESIRIRPNSATALNYLGYMWVERDAHIDEAYALIGRALLIKPNDASILDSMGWVLYKKEKFDKAALYLERAAEYNPIDPTINMHLGDVYEKLERFESANIHWKRALKLNPETKKDVQHLKLKLNKAKASIKLK